MPKATSKSRAGPAAAASKKRAKAHAEPKAGPGKSGRTARKAPRLPPRKTFLVAATMPDGSAKPDLCVYAAVTRTPGDALAAVRAQLGEGISVELTGKLSNRMAKTLGLKADEVRQI